MRPSAAQCATPGIAHRIIILAGIVLLSAAWLSLIVMPRQAAGATHGRVALDVIAPPNCWITVVEDENSATTPAEKVGHTLGLNVKVARDCNKPLRFETIVVGQESANDGRNTVSVTLTVNN